MFKIIDKIIYYNNIYCNNKYNDICYKYCLSVYTYNVYI